MNLEETLATIEKTIKGFEAAQVTTYRAYRKNKKGVDKEVTIEVLDRGPGKPDLRYLVIATDQDGKQASGNSGPNLEVVLATVHWYDLDRDA